METAMYFVRYFIPTLLSLSVVILLTIFNHYIGPIILHGRIVERFEVFHYSVFIAGPIAFSVSFLLFFYGLEITKDNWAYGKMVFIIACVLAVIGFIANIYFLPKYNLHS